MRQRRNRAFQCLLHSCDQIGCERSVCKVIHLVLKNPGSCYMEASLESDTKTGRRHCTFASDSLASIFAIAAASLILPFHIQAWIPKKPATKMITTTTPMM